jgi:DNA-directed RNA polymerase delta subunit
MTSRGGREKWQIRSIYHFDSMNEKSWVTQRDYIIRRERGKEYQES